MSQEDRIESTLHHGTPAEVRALRCPKTGGPLRIEYCETASGSRHFRVTGLRSDFIVRSSGRFPRPTCVDTLGADFVTGSDTTDDAHEKT
jgi:hypothetical protein